MALLWQPKAEKLNVHPSESDLKARAPSRDEIFWMLEEVKQLQSKHEMGKLSAHERETGAYELPNLLKYFCASIRASDGKKVDEENLNKEYQRLAFEVEKRVVAAEQSFGSSSSDARIHTTIHYLAEELRKAAGEIKNE